MGFLVPAKNLHTDALVSGGRATRDHLHDAASSAAIFPCPHQKAIIDSFTDPCLRAGRYRRHTPSTVECSLQPALPSQRRAPGSLQLADLSTSRHATIQHGFRTVTGKVDMEAAIVKPQSIQDPETEARNENGDGHQAPDIAPPDYSSQSLESGTVSPPLFEFLAHPDAYTTSSAPIDIQISDIPPEIRPSSREAPNSAAFPNH
ncbi:uncharacterized protein N7496_005922 [Penicillium cataractarum]|uniref:Uncharacterized protein n=1 Tax=Penicillium cataractarum TaxID=2100454 RepID=A0A9W9S0T9_9EURO|nr:uncharacterized protein N7496_005922 [Penicillium cataractarum]KAJ5369830.1 hypothetical protein N7496_005922 [Penicillium cataractarum]